MSVVWNSAGCDALDVEVTLADDHASLYLVGELDLATAPLLDEALNLAYDHDPAMLVLDLAALTFIDSTGINRLVAALKHQRAHGGELILRSPQASTLRVLEIVGLTQVFAIL
jgi:anti-anti-sigma factor